MKTLNEFVHNNYVSLEGIEESLLKSISNLDNQKINECCGCCCEPCCGDKCCDPYCYPKYCSESEITDGEDGSIELSSTTNGLLIAFSSFTTLSSASW